MKCVGKIKEAHSLKGELYALVFSQDLSWIEDLEQVHLGQQDQNRNLIGELKAFAVVQYKPHKKGMILKLEGIKDRTEAEKWEGFGIFISEDQLVSKPGETIYLNEILGFELLDQNQKFWGVVKEFQSNGPQDLLVIKLDTKEYLVPFVEEFISKIDFENKKLFMNLPDGLFE